MGFFELVLKSGDILMISLHTWTINISRFVMETPVNPN